MKEVKVEGIFKTDYLVKPSKAWAGDVALYNKDKGKIEIIQGDYFIDNTSEFPASKYSPVGVVVVPGKHDVYGTKECAVISHVPMNYSTPDVGGTSEQIMYWGQWKIDTSLTNYYTQCHIGNNGNPRDTIQGVSSVYVDLPSDIFTLIQNPEDRESYYFYNNTNYYAPSPYKSDGSYNPIYSQTTSPSTAANCLSDFDGVGNTKILCDLATKQSNWKNKGSEPVTKTYQTSSNIKVREVSHELDGPCSYTSSGTSYQFYGDAMNPCNGSLTLEFSGNKGDVFIMYVANSGAGVSNIEAEEGNEKVEYIGCSNYYYIYSLLEDGSAELTFEWAWIGDNALLDGGDNYIDISLYSRQISMTTGGWNPITNNYNSGYSPAACCCWRYHTEGTKQGDWYLPAMGELGYMMVRIKAINQSINALKLAYGSGVAVSTSNSQYWSSTEYGSTDAKYLATGVGSLGYRTKGNTTYARAFLRL